MSKKVAIYARVSTLEQAESGYSINEQVSRLTKYCDIQGWHIQDTYIDGGYSGSSLDRPQMQRMLNNIGKYDTVLCLKLDRLSRSQRDTLTLIEETFNKNNISLVSLNENLDTNSPVGKAVVGLLSVFAQLEREQIKERFTMGKIGRAKAGLPMNFVQPAYGYTYDKDTSSLEINEYEASIVKQIFADYLAGVSRKKIAESLTLKGIKKTRGNWSTSTILHALTCKTYIGLVNYKDQYYQGKHEPIITKADFDKVQAELKKRSRKNLERINQTRPYEGKYLLSGRIFCKNCGAPMFVTYSNQQKEKGNIYIKCKNKKVKTPRKDKYRDGKTCESSSLLLKPIEYTVLSEISKLQSDKDYMLGLLSTNDNKLNEGVVLDEIKAINKKVEKLNDLYLNDLISLDDLKAKTSGLKTQKETLQKQIKEQPAPLFDINELMNIIEGIDVLNMSLEEQKQIINALLKSVYVDENNVEINYVF